MSIMTPPRLRSGSPALGAALLGLSLILSACDGGTGGGNPNPGGTPLYTVSGNVLAPGVSAQGDQPLGAQAVQNADWNAPHVRGQVLINASDLGAQTLSAQSLSALSGVRTQTLSSAGLTLAYTPAGQTDAEFAARLVQSGLSAQPNYIYQALAAPNDPGYPGNAGVDVGGVKYDQDYLTRINVLAAWDKLASLGKQPVGAKVAILDTGVDFGHEDLAGRLLPGRDFCSALDDSSVCTGEDPDASDLTSGGEAGHGTSSTGLIGAVGNNGKGIVGLTWSGQTLLPVKVFGERGAVSGATTSSLRAGLDYAVAQGARVINMSLGLRGVNTDPALAVALSAASKQALLVAAAGNTPNEGLYYPASDPNVLAVGAVGKTDALACYSARPRPGQKGLDLVAPGGNAGSGTGNCFQSGGEDILTMTTTALGKYTLRAGTSEAAPLVSGAAALMLGLRPDLSPDQIRSLLIGTAKTVSGGRLLDVGAAVQAASLAGSGTPPNTYKLRVDAIQNGAVVNSYVLPQTQGAAPQRLPYSIGKLPAGTYTLNATLTTGNTVSSGQVTATIGGDSTLNIPTR
jgi:subtilisin family serine protease